jgi:hypothetical protein
MLRAASTLVLLGVVAGAGCVRHEAALTLAASPADAMSQGAVLADQPMTGDATRRHHLPLDLPATAWWRDGTGAIWRADAVATTPLRWWQRFPCDLVADLLPGPVTARTAVHLAPTPVAVVSAPHLADNARAAGFAVDTP